MPDFQQMNSLSEGFFKRVLSMSETDDTLTTLTRIANALERLAPPKTADIDMKSHQGYIWVSEKSSFHAVDEIQRLPLDSLQGIDQQKQQLLENTEYFAKGM